LTLYAASSDGTIAVFDFDPEELDGIAPHSVQEQYLQKFGFTPPPLPENFSHLAKQQTSPQSPIEQSSNVNGERVNVLIAKRGPKKRAKLHPGGSFMNGTGTSISAPPMSKRMHMDDLSIPSASISSAIPASVSTSISVGPSAFEQAFEVPADTWGGMGMDLDVPIDVIDGRGKRKASNVHDLTEDMRPTTKARTLGGDRARDSVVVKEIGRDMNAVVGGAVWDAGSSRASLPVPPLLTSLTAEIEGTDEVFEGRNSEDGGMLFPFLCTWGLLLICL
jgi:protein HIRA/HIR1